MELGDGVKVTTPAAEGHLIGVLNEPLPNVPDDNDDPKTTMFSSLDYEIAFRAKALTVLLTRGTSIAKAAVSEVAKNHVNGELRGHAIQALAYGLSDAERAQLELGEGWTSSRGRGDLAATNLEYSKLFLGAVLLGTGVNNIDLQISQSSSGRWEYTPGQIYLNPAFHRSWDEWRPLISDEDWTVCDSLSPSSGAFTCEKERFRNWPAPKQYRWFGYPSDSNVFDATTDVGWSVEDFNPETTEAIPVHWTFQKKRELQYFCPLFEDDQGNADQMVLPRVIFNLVANNWYVNMDRRPKGDPRSSAFIVSPKHSNQREAVGRNDSDDALSYFQVAHEAMCDLSGATQSWVPLMVNEVAGEGFRDEAERDRYDNIDDGKAPYGCSSMRDLLVGTPPSASDCGPDGYSCNDVSDCPGGYNDCFASCCGILR